MRNSKIILAKNIKLDRNYNNVLNYTEQQMVELCTNNKVAEANDFSFIRTTRNIKTPFSYAQCLEANYIAFQNPDYSNKWFFAWIDDVIYKSDGCGEISFTIDAWSTWFSKLNIGQCFVVREHVNDDTIGLHTIPENLDIGEIICERVTEFLNQNSNSLYYVLESTYNPKTKKDFEGVAINNGILSGSELYCFKGDNNARGKISNFIDIINQDGKIESIKNLYILPSFLLDNIGVVDDSFIRDNVTYEFSKLVYSTNVSILTLSAYIPKNFNGITLKNNKCKCYPYNYLLASNNVGNYNIYKYENFEQEYDEITGENQVFFDIEMAVSVGGSIRLVPLDYKNIPRNYDEAVPLGKFPTCSWSSDAFTNWLTQNAVNITTSIGATVAGIGMSLATGGAGAIAGAGIAISGATSVAGIIGQFRDATLLPSIQGGNNSADVNFSARKNSFSLYHMRVKNEYLQIIDDYFTKYGYKINRVKQPNITGRAIFNYIEIEKSSDLGYGEIPPKFLDTINSIARNGVTIWHNHANIGNYNMNNNII